MYEITKKEYLSKTSVLMNVKAPLVAAKAEAGQFILSLIHISEPTRPY